MLGKVFFKYAYAHIAPWIAMLGAGTVGDPSRLPVLLAGLLCRYFIPTEG